MSSGTSTRDEQSPEINPTISTTIIVRNVYARGTEKNRFELKVQEDRTIADVKDQIHEQLASDTFLPANQKLVFRGKLCPDATLLADILKIVNSEDRSEPQTFHLMLTKSRPADKKPPPPTPVMASSSIIAPRTRSDSNIAASEPAAAPARTLGIRNRANSSTCSIRAPINETATPQHSERCGNVERIGPQFVQPIPQCQLSQAQQTMLQMQQMQQMQLLQMQQQNLISLQEQMHKSYSLLQHGVASTSAEARAKQTLVERGNLAQHQQHHAMMWQHHQMSMWWLFQAQQQVQQKQMQSQHQLASTCSSSPNTGNSKSSSAFCDQEQQHHHQQQQQQQLEHQAQVVSQVRVGLRRSDSRGAFGRSFTVKLVVAVMLPIVFSVVAIGLELYVS